MIAPIAMEGCASQFVKVVARSEQARCRKVLNKRSWVFGFCAFDKTKTKDQRPKTKPKGQQKMLNEKPNRLKAYDHRVLDQSTTEIVETAKRTARVWLGHTLADRQEQVDRASLPTRRIQNRVSILRSERITSDGFSIRRRRRLTR